MDNEEVFVGEHLRIPRRSPAVSCSLSSLAPSVLARIEFSSHSPIGIQADSRGEGRWDLCNVTCPGSCWSHSSSCLLFTAPGLTEVCGHSPPTPISELVVHHYKGLGPVHHCSFRGFGTSPRHNSASGAGPITFPVVKGASHGPRNPWQATGGLPILIIS